MPRKIPKRKKVQAARRRALAALEARQYPLHRRKPTPLTGLPIAPPDLDSLYGFMEALGRAARYALEPLRRKD